MTLCVAIVTVATEERGENGLFTGLIGPTVNLFIVRSTNYSGSFVTVQMTWFKHVFNFFTSSLPSLDY